MAIRKLQLHKETLRRLTGKELSQVVGGKKKKYERTEKTLRSIFCKSAKCGPAPGDPPEPSIDYAV